MAHKARKRFGQHFLNDAFVIQKLVEQIKISESDNVIEIGPGLGAMTIPLLQQTPAKNYVALEIDRDVIKHLENTCSSFKNFSIIESDALKVNLDDVLASEKNIRVIGNLPYNISTPLIFHLLNYKQRITDMVFMLQKEVVDRIVAKPNNKTYGRLSVMVQAQCNAESLFDVPPEAFNPPPKVDSAIVKIVPKASSESSELTRSPLFANVVRGAFNQRRKTIRNSLKEFVTAEQLTNLDIDPKLRAENLSVENFVTITEYVNSNQVTR